MLREHVAHGRSASARKAAEPRDDRRSSDAGQGNGSNDVTCGGKTMDPCSIQRDQEAPTTPPQVGSPRIKSKINAPIFPQLGIYNF